MTRLLGILVLATVILGGCKEKEITSLGNDNFQLAVPDKVGISIRDLTKKAEDYCASQKMRCTEGLNPGECPPAPMVCLQKNHCLLERQHDRSTPTLLKFVFRCQNK